MKDFHAGNWSPSDDEQNGEHKIKNNYQAW